MSEQQKQSRIRPIVFISAIIFASVIIWVAVKGYPYKLAHTGQYNYHSERPSLEAQAETTSDANQPKLSLNDVIKTARYWSPAHTSWYGKTAPDFTLRDINGKWHKLSDYRGKNVLIIFWATWCGPCKTEIPHLIALRNIVSEDKLAMLAISNENPALVKRFAVRWKINYTVLLDTGKMPIPYSYVNAIPSSFFINPDGKIKLATVGLLSLGTIKAILQAE